MALKLLILQLVWKLTEVSLFWGKKNEKSKAQTLPKRI